MKNHALMFAEVRPGIWINRSGKVISTRRKTIKTKGQQKNYKGYMYAHVGTLDEPDKVSVHRLILEAFVGPADGRVAMHLNNIRDDNRLENLRWGTPKENSEQMVRENRSRGRPAKTSSEFLAAARDPSISCRDVSRMHGVSEGYVSLVRAGKRRGGAI